MKDITQAAALLAELKALVDSLSGIERAGVLGVVRSLADCAAEKERELAMASPMLARRCCA